VNRSLHWVAALLFVTFLAAPAAAQVPLTVGSVRDQEGEPIEGAVVTVQGVDPASSTVTDASGTFALAAGGAVSLRISCRYCRSTTVAARPNEPVVAIVQRYLALAHETPTAADLLSLPYAHVESALGLRPFALVAQSLSAYPGARVSDRGLSSSGSLLLDNGVPNYDVSNGQSPYVFIPAYYEQSAALDSATEAFLYGNPAAGGTVDASPFANGTAAQILEAGSSTIVRAQAGSGTTALALASLASTAESRQRSDLEASFSLPADQSLSLATGGEQSHAFQPESFAGSYSWGRATFNDPRALNLSLSAISDRANYFIKVGEYPISSAWSDSGFSAGIHTTGPIAGFADVAVRTSTGFYDAQAQPVSLPRVGAMLAQSHIDGGFIATGPQYSIVGGFGAFWINYSGGTLGISQPAKGGFLLPSLDARLFPNGKWSVDLQGSGSLTLPTFVEQYQYAAGLPAPLAAERNTLFAGALTYTDDARLRLSFEQASQNTHGAWTGTTTSTGFSAIWQIAPAISLRAWTMHVDDTLPLYGGGLPYGGTAPTVNALWLTYDLPAGVRADAIYRRDLLDGAPFYHFDGAVSGPIANGLRWFAGAEDWMHRTFVQVGIRFLGH
jgi:hypothetical protein